MTKREAQDEANRRWFTGGIGPRDVVAWASRCRNSPIYRVGARRRGPGLTAEDYIVARGTSDVSWEDAFADADRRKAGVG